jgi:hypothetical protein
MVRVVLLELFHLLVVVVVAVQIQILLGLAVLVVVVLIGLQAEDQVVQEHRIKGMAVEAVVVAMVAAVVVVVHHKQEQAALHQVAVKVAMVFLHQ